MKQQDVEFETLLWEWFAAESAIKEAEVAAECAQNAVLNALKSPLSQSDLHLARLQSMKALFTWSLESGYLHPARKELVKYKISALSQQVSGKTAPLQSQNSRDSDFP